MGAVTRVPITDVVLDQLAAIVASDEVVDPNNRFAVRAVAMNEGHDELATFIGDADAVRYTRALELLEGRRD